MGGLICAAFQVPSDEWSSDCRSNTTSAALLLTSELSANAEISLDETEPIEEIERGIPEDQ